MVIKFNGVETNFQFSSAIEQKLYKQRQANGWLISLNISGNFTAQELDSVLTTESISKITLIGETEENTVISGYEKITSCVVRYSGDKTTAEISLTKGA